MIKRNNIIYYVLLIFCFNVQYAISQEHPIKYFNLREGLPHSMVPDFFQDSKGNLWIPTYGGGISKYNGKVFKNYGLNNGLSNLVTRTIAEYKNDDILIGTIGSGLFCLKNDTIIPLLKKLSAKEIFCLRVDENYTIWAGTEIGLIKINPDSTIENISLKYNLPEFAVTFMNRDHSGNIWFGYDTEYGLHKFNGKEILSFDAKNGLTNERILSVFQDSDDNSWIGAHDGVYYIPKNGKSAKKIEIQGIPNYYVFNFIEPRKGLLLFGSNNNGLFLMDTKKQQVINNIHIKQGLKSSIVFRVFNDKENNIWISNWGEGIALLPFNGLSRYTEKWGIENRLVYSLKNIDNNLVAVSVSGIYYYRNGTFVKEFKNLPEGITDIIKFRDEYLATDGKFIYIIKNGSVKKITEKNILGVRGFVLTNNNTVYLTGWGCGIIEYDGKKFNTLTDTTVSRYKYFYSCFKDSKQNLWFASHDAGLLGLVDGKWLNFSTDKGLPSKIVTAITEDKNGNIIVGTNGGGIAVIRHNKVKVINSLNGLPSNVVNSVLVDSDNNLWAGLQGGIVKIKLSNNHIEIFSSETGFDGDCLNSSIIEFNKDIWIGTNNYLWKYSKNEIIPKQKNLSVIINQILVNDLLVDNPTNLHYRQNKLHFEFYAPQLFDGKNVKYSYRLLGADSLYSKPSFVDEVTFYELPPGKYTFEVKAILNKEESKSPTRFYFTIHPPFYKTWWFLTLCVLTGIVFIRYYIIFRERKLKKKQIELENIVSERTQEITKQKHLIEEKQKEILDSIQYAKRIQLTLLAHEETLNTFLNSSTNTQTFAKNYFVLFKPKDIVSGDFYWATHTHVNNRECFYIAVCDSTGHGVPGAFMSLLNISFLNEAINEKKIEKPSKIFDYVRNRLELSISKEGAQDGMDGILLKISKGENGIACEYAAANNSPVLIRNKEIIALEYDKMPIGKGLKNQPFSNHKLNIMPGDEIYLYTDGYADQFGGPKGKKFMYKQLNSLLLEISHLNEHDKKAILEKKFSDWKGSLEQVDDVCLAGIFF